MQNEADIFRELAPLLRVRPELQQLCRFGAQWSSRHEAEDKGWAPFHIVTQGACLLDAGERLGILLKAGDAAVLPHGGPHTIRAVPTAAGAVMAVRIHRRLHDALVVKSNVEGEPDTKLICGRLRFEHARDNLVLAALPAVVVLGGATGRDGARLQRIIETIQDELEEDRLGAAPIAAALASSLMMFVLRAHFESQRDAQGILALLARRQTARALAGMLTEPARSWRLDELAAHANTSRATLVRLFQKAVNAAPLAYLSELRLTMARHRVLATSLPLAVIAEEVGYQSETAFSRAYQRRFAIAPGADRKGAIDGRRGSASAEGGNRPSA
jgi:AraC family transcriptional regulator, activator of mtrCDE